MIHEKHFERVFVSQCCNKLVYDFEVVLGKHEKLANLSV